MGVFDYIDRGDGDFSQVKCFDRQMRTYKIGDAVPLNGTYSIALVEGGWANVNGGWLLSITKRPKHGKQIDKWGNPWDADDNRYGENHPYRRMVEEALREEGLLNG